MGKTCVICGRQIKSGRKYCFSCRGIEHSRSSREKRVPYPIRFLVSILLIVGGVLLLYTWSKDGSGFDSTYLFPVVLILLGIYLIGANILNLHKKNKLDFVSCLGFIGAVIIGSIVLKIYLLTIISSIAFVILFFIYLIYKRKYSKEK